MDPEFAIAVAHKIAQGMGFALRNMVVGIIVMLLGF